MDTLEIIVAIAIAVILLAVAGFFLVRQRQTLRTVRADAAMPEDQRQYLLRQARRRMFGSVLLILLAGMLVGSLFFDYEPIRMPIEQVPLEQQEAAKQTVRLFGVYWMGFLLILMAVMALAVADFWATARYSVQQQRQLFQQHRDMLEAELTEHKYRQGNSNGSTH